MGGSQKDKLPTNLSSRSDVLVSLCVRVVRVLCCWSLGRTRGSLPPLRCRNTSRARLKASWSACGLSGAPTTRPPRPVTPRQGTLASALGRAAWRLVPSGAQSFRRVTWFSLPSRHPPPSLPLRRPCRLHSAAGDTHFREPRFLSFPASSCHGGDTRGFRRGARLAGYMSPATAVAGQEIVFWSAQHRGEKLGTKKKKYEVQLGA